MATNKVKIESHFPAAKRAAWETVQSARALALAAGKETAIRKVEALNDQRGYNLPEDMIDSENIGHQSGRVYIGGDDQFYWRFFEYGTKDIPAFPMIRPASTAMRKVFLAQMGGSLERFIRARARA
jgi:HK97 gp10 family phage protein